MTIDVSLIPQNRVENLISKLSEIENNIGNIGTDITNNLVHKTGDETISGNKTFNNEIYSTTTNVINRITTQGNASVRMFDYNSAVYTRVRSINNNASTPKETYIDVRAYENGTTQISFNADEVYAPTPANGDNSTKIATTNWCYDPAKSTNLVHRSGDETITDLKTFKSNSNGIALATKSQVINSDVTPSSIQFSNFIDGYDVNGKLISRAFTAKNTNGANSIAIQAWKGSTNYDISVDSNGVTHAPTPPASDNSTNIATTNWCYDPAKSTNLVHRTGNETINGTKTFNDSNVITNKEFISLTSSPYGQFRAIEGNYGFFIRNDGNATYFLLTNSNDQYGSWNSLRPLTIENASGKVRINNSVVSGFVKETWKSGTSWYRVWSDGWIEQGGRYQYSGTNAGFQAMTYPRAFTTTEYQIVGTGYRSDSSPWQGFITFKDWTTTGCNCACWDDTTSNPSLFNWYACGY